MTLVVQAGEGTEDIIYRRASIPAGTTAYGGYLARPDGQHEWPTVIVYGPDPVPNATIKYICRMFARHGIAAIAPEFTSDPDRDLRISRAVSTFIGAPNGDWSNAEDGFGVVAFEDGLSTGARLTAMDRRVVAIASIGSTLTDDVVDRLAGADVPMLFVGSRADEGADIDVSLAARDRLPRTTFAVYPDGDHGFWNDHADGFRQDRFEDAMDRAISFMSGRLPGRR